MSIRLRLTLIFSSILAFTLISFSVTLFAVQSQFTLNMIESDLERTVNPMINRFSFMLMGNERPIPPRPEADPDNPVEFPWFDPSALEADESRERDFIRILDADGNPIDTPINQESTSYPISTKGLAELNNGETWTEIIVKEEERLLVYNHPIIREDATLAIIQISRSLADRDRSLQSLGITLITGSVVTTLVAFGGGLFLAGTTLKPVKDITQTANSIGQVRDFSARVDYSGPDDEIGHLATTFNKMLSQLEEGYEQVSHSLEVQRDFVADVSHELRTPLTTIRGNLDLLKREPPLPEVEQVDILSDLTSESERLSRLVHDLLILARADAGRTLSCDIVDVSAITEDVLRQMSLLTPSCQILFTDDKPASACANEDALKQVLLIVLDNAVKHAQCPIKVNLFHNKDDVRICIQDSGPGMAQHQLERIFDRFYRGDASRSSSGFGLGLSIAMTLIEAQHGTIEVESEVGTGSTFTITLPRHP